MSNEKALFAQEVAQVEQWWKVRVTPCPMITRSPCPQSPRFARAKRPYTAADVVSKRGTIPIQYPSNLMAQKLWATLSGHAKRGTPSHTYGA